MALIILGASSAAIAISLLGLGALRAWLAGSDIDEQERRKFAQALGTTLKSKRAPIIQSLRTRLEESCNEMKQELDQEMQELIADTKGQLKKAIEMRQHQQEQVSPHRQKILDAQHKIAQIHIDISEMITDD